MSKQKRIFAENFREIEGWIKVIVKVTVRNRENSL